MSIATLTTPLSQGLPPRLWTVADIAALPDESPSGPVRYELDNGRLITMPPSGGEHGWVESNVDTHLKVQGEWRGHGLALTGEVGVILWRNPDRLVGVDSMFVTAGSLPLRFSPEGYVENIPDLVSEIRSKNDTWPECERKIKDYHRAGVKVVWLVDPRARTVTAFRAGQPPQVFTENDVLTIDDVIPGFAVPVRQLFDR